MVKYLNVRGKLNHAHNKARHRDVAYSAAPARGVMCNVKETEGRQSRVLIGQSQRVVPSW